ncbi:hypothetical protein [uncultured Roseibium sp.]|uniref:hypothetical protein n=1 Tax=uncultured Roseibium sp. TaxID=1936171 RepID=UPI00262B6EFC|nr:hypothetical protein [uncultured Roseibium sp.]
MSASKGVPASGSINLFQELAAQRGEGLHPFLLEALAKTGSVSGPLADSETNSANVIPVQFGKLPSSRDDQKEATR